MTQFIDTYYKNWFHYRLHKLSSRNYIIQKSLFSSIFFVVVDSKVEFSFFSENVLYVKRIHSSSDNTSRTRDSHHYISALFSEFLDRSPVSAILLVLPISLITIHYKAQTIALRTNALPNISTVKSS